MAAVRAGWVGLQGLRVRPARVWLDLVELQILLRLVDQAVAAPAPDLDVTVLVRLQAYLRRVVEQTVETKTLEERVVDRSANEEDPE